jgi:hypothetical protein
MDRAQRISRSINRVRQQWRPIAGALLGGIIVYLTWLAAFLGMNALGQTDAQGALWVLSPIVTGIGFAAGYTLMKRKAGYAETRMRHVLPWPVAGCAIGAAAVYWFGQMLIVFAMLLVGAGSICLMEGVAEYGRS